MNYKNSNELQPINLENFQSSKFKNNFYQNSIPIDHSLWPKDKLIPVVFFVNKNIMKDGKEIDNHDYKNSLKYSALPNPNQPPIDEWVPAPEDKIFDHIRGAIIVPVHKFYNMPDDCKANEMFDYFYVTAKRCYNSIFWR